MLFIEYDVTSDGMVELVALIDAVEEDGADPDGQAWIEWRRTHEDAGMGCAAVPPMPWRRWRRPRTQKSCGRSSRA